MVIFSKEDVTKYTKQLQNAISEQIDPENPLELRKYLAELSSYMGLMSGLAASARYYKDRSKDDYYLLNGVDELSSNMKNRLTAIQSILSYHKSELASHHLQ